MELNPRYPLVGDQGLRVGKEEILMGKGGWETKFHKRIARSPTVLPIPSWQRFADTILRPITNALLPDALKLEGMIRYHHLITWRWLKWCKCNLPKRSIFSTYLFLCRSAHFPNLLCHSPYQHAFLEQTPINHEFFLVRTAQGLIFLYFRNVFQSYNTTIESLQINHLFIF